VAEGTARHERLPFYRQPVHHVDRARGGACRTGIGRADPGFVAGSNRWLALPAMLLVWAFGLTLAVSAGWLSSPWLQVKLAFVALLSALHAIQSGQLRRLVRMKGPKPWTSVPLILVLLFVVVALAVVKP
jgi:hypothetical protein